MSKFTAFLSTTSVDEAIVDFLRTGLSTAIAVSLGLGIPLLDISGGDFRTVLSAALAAGPGTDLPGRRLAARPGLCVALGRHDHHRRRRQHRGDEGHRDHPADLSRPFDG